MEILTKSAHLCHLHWHQWSRRVALTSWTQPRTSWKWLAKRKLGTLTTAESLSHSPMQDLRMSQCVCLLCDQKSSQKRFVCEFIPVQVRELLLSWKIFGLGAIACEVISFLVAASLSLAIVFIRNISKNIGLFISKLINNNNWNWTFSYNCLNKKVKGIFTQCTYTNMIFFETLKVFDTKSSKGNLILSDCSCTPVERTDCYFHFHLYNNQIH